MKILVFLLLITSDAFAQTNAPSAFTKLTVDEALKKAKEEKKKLFVFVSATWIGPARAMKNITFADKDFIAAINKNFIAIEIDADEDETYVKQYNVKSLPTILIFDGENKELTRIVGVLPSGVILERLSRL